jgi:hypothetical protein
MAGCCFGNSQFEIRNPDESHEHRRARALRGGARLSS